MATVAIAPISAEADRSDGALVEAHLDGQSRAFDILYQRHRDRLVRFCWKQTHDLPLAEDLAQEAMIRYLRKADTFDTSQPMWPWLQTIARNLVIDHYRRTSNDPHLDPDLGNADDGTTACTMRFDRIAERSELAQVLAELPERQRVALRLHHGQDWTTADVADYLDIKVNACKQLLYRARKNARKYYEELVDRTEASFSILFAHPLFLALRERFQRSRTQLEALATDVASMTIALDAVAERAVAALAVIATVALGGVDVSFAMEPASSVNTTPVSQNGQGLSVAPQAPSTPNVPKLESRAPARPATNDMGSRRARLSASAETSLPGVGSMSSGLDHERSEDRATVRREVTVDLGPYPPTDETTVTIECEGSQTAQTTCAVLDELEDTEDAAVPTSR